MYGDLPRVVLSAASETQPKVLYVESRWLTLQMSGWWAGDFVEVPSLPVPASSAVTMDTAGQHAVGLLPAGRNQWSAAGLVHSGTHASLGASAPTVSQGTSLLFKWCTV